MLEKIQNWKLRQNMVLTLFLNTWIQLNVEERENLPVRVQTGAQNFVTDVEGNELCCYSMIDSMPYVHWFRSFDDYDILDKIGREYGDTEAAGVDDAVGDDGGIEAEKGV